MNHFRVGDRVRILYGRDSIPPIKSFWCNRTGTVSKISKPKGGVRGGLLYEVTLDPKKGDPFRAGWFRENEIAEDFLLICEDAMKEC